MNNLKYSIALTVIIPLLACRDNEQPPVDALKNLVWSDEFDKPGAPDATKWNYDVGDGCPNVCGWGNNELQYYTAGRLENARVEDGHLTIEARKEPWEGKEYTSVRLITRGKAEWQYGKIEVRALLPDGRGTWPAIWMLAGKQPLKWPDDGEIDIMEHVGYNQGYIHGSIHTKKYNHVINTQKTDTVFVDDCSKNYHRYQVEWNADSVIVGIDDQPFFRAANDGTGYEAWPFDNKMFLLLNIAVGGNWGGQKGVDETIWPRRMEVDYVRVWQKKN